MDTPPIQYVKTSDGVSIAYYTMGGGPLPVVWIELPSQLQLEQKLFQDQMRAYRQMSRLGTLVRYDHRGFGLSDRSVTTFALDDLVKDLEAVVEKLTLEKFFVIGATIFGSAVAAAYAGAHPERVSKLVLGATNVSPPVYEQTAALMHAGSDWQFVSEAVARLTLGWNDEESSRELAAWFRESSSYETFRAFWQDIGKWDVRDLLSKIEAQTLIAYAPEIKLATLGQVQEMASLIRDSQLVVAEELTYGARTAKYEAAVAIFLYGSDITQPRAPSSALPSGTAIILFADIVDSTGLTERLGDTAFRVKARQLDEAMQKAIRETNGSAIEGKLLGDGVLAVFTAARDALAAAIACREQCANLGLELHLSIHAGDVIREKDNVYGGAVNIAARIAATSAPGEILVSDTVRALARTSAGVMFEDRGEKSLKGIDDPVRVWAVASQPQVELFEGDLRPS